MVPLKMETTQGVQVLKDKGIKPQIIYIDADHHYEPCKKDIQACLRAFPDAILVGDDYGHYESVRNAVTECALEFDKHVHVDQNHCWTYHRGVGHWAGPSNRSPRRRSRLASGSLSLFTFTPSPRRSHETRGTYLLRFRLSGPKLRLPPLPAELPLLQAVQAALLLLDHQKVLRAPLLGVRLAARMRFQLELFSVEHLAGFPLFDGRASFDRFWDDVGTGQQTSVRGAAFNSSRSSFQ